MSRLYCTCGQWSQPIPDDSRLHWTIYEDLPRCPHRRWWNAWLHYSITERSPLADRLPYAQATARCDPPPKNT